MISSDIINEYIKWACKVKKLGSPDKWDDKEFNDGKKIDDDWDSFDTVINANYVNKMLNENESLIKKELDSNSEVEEKIAGLTVIYSNEIEKTLASKIAMNKMTYNKYIDKKIRVIVDKDINSDRFEVEEKDDIVIISMGILNESYEDFDKTFFIEDDNYREKLSGGTIRFLCDIKNNMAANGLNYLMNLSNIKNVILLLLEKYENSMINDMKQKHHELAPMSKEELINYTLKFLSDVDKSGKLCNLLFSAIDNGDLIIATNDIEKQAVRSKFGSVNIMSSCVDYNINKILIEGNGNINDFVILVHELMHYNSMVKNKDEANAKNNDFDSYFSEFASIYFEYLAGDYAKKDGKDTDLFILRSKNAMKDLKQLLFIIDILILSINDDLNYKAYNSLMKKYNLSIDESRKLCLQIDKTLFQILPYMLGILLSKSSIEKEIDPKIMIDISDNLYKYSSLEILSKLGIYTDELKIDKNSSNRHK